MSGLCFHELSGGICDDRLFGVNERLKFGELQISSASACTAAGDSSAHSGHGHFRDHHGPLFMQ